MGLFLGDNGADLNIRTMNGRLIEIAFEINKHHFIKYLINKNVKINFNINQYHSATDALIDPLRLFYI
jgi:hypothetical protein